MFRIGTACPYVSTCSNQRRWAAYPPPQAFRDFRPEYSVYNVITLVFSTADTLFPLISGSYFLGSTPSLAREIPY